MEELVRKNVLEITPYVAGKPVEETKRELKLKKVIKLASNENPLGGSPKAIAAIKKNLSGINRYPDSQGFYLKRKLSRTLNIHPSNIVLGNGSDEIIDIIIKAFVESDENVITADVTFLEYGIISQINNRQIITAPLKYFKYDLDAIKKRIGRKTKLIFISNPNNPTGTYIAKDELREFIDNLPETVILVLDEAYDTFIDEEDFGYGIGYINEKNVIVLKTFSKGYGLAGLRVGYALARPGLSLYMERVRQPFNTNFLAQVAAAAALDDEIFLAKTRKAVLEGKEFIYKALSKMGLAYVRSAANFILIDTGKDGVTVFKDMLKYGVIIRDMQQYGLKNYIRVTIGTKKENEKFISVLKKVL